MDTLLDTSPDHRPNAAEALRHHWLTGEQAPIAAGALGAGRRARSGRREAELREEAEEGTAADGDADGDTTLSGDANGTTVQRVRGRAVIIILNKTASLF